MEAFFDQCMTSATEVSAVIFSCTACRQDSAYIVTPGQVLPEKSNDPIFVPGMRAQAHANSFHVWYLQRHWAIGDRHNGS